MHARSPLAGSSGQDASAFGKRLKQKFSCCEEKKLFGSMGLNNVTDPVLTVRSAGEILLYCTFCLACLCSNVRIALPPSPLLDYRSSSLVWDISFQWWRSAEFDLTSEKPGSNILSQWCTQLWLLSDKERISQDYILWETEFKSKTCYNLVESIVFLLFVSSIWSSLMFTVVAQQSSSICTTDHISTSKWWWWWWWCTCVFRDRAALLMGPLLFAPLLLLL